MRFLHRWPPGSALFQGDNLVFHDYVPYRWPHVVAQTSGGRMELYLNGTGLPPISTNSGPASDPCRFFVGMLKPRPRPPQTWERRPFVGQIDEIALYERPLSVAEIRHHYALGSTGGRPSEP